MTFEEIKQAFTHNTPVEVIIPYGHRHCAVILNNIRPAELSDEALQTDEIDITPVMKQNYEALYVFFNETPPPSKAWQELSPMVVEKRHFQYIHVVKEQS